jgi:DNA modification methylase
MSLYYDHAGIQIHLGDCEEIICDLDLDFILTDPPYGVGFSYDSHEDTDETFEDVKRVIVECVKSSNQMLLFMSMKRLWEMPRPKTLMCWAKPGSVRVNPMGGFSEWEPILVYGKARYFNDLKILPDCSNHLKEAIGHPCPKPIRLFQWLLKTNVTEWETVTDPFMGSGTTLVAAKAFGKKAVGIEKSEKYCEIAAKRLSQEVFDFS